MSVKGGGPSGGRRRIDRILAPEFLDGLGGISLPDLRSKRTECVEEETLLSYERRLLQGRLDILEAELRRRSGEETGSIVERLAEILADEPRPSRGAFPQAVALPSFDNPRRRVEKLVSDDTLASLPELPDDRVREIVEALRSAEQAVSEQRREVQRVLDEVTGEVGRRYKTGEADPTDVLSTGR
ncbi:MAG: aerial mycelium formation protein [Acidobacteria bacterium]|nr:aerial mycelium formation protein [Acidobacteriota bacterium]